MVAVRKTQYAALSALIASIIAAGCGSTQSGSTSASPMQQGTPDMSAPLVNVPSPDPRVGLKAGLQDAGEAIWNLQKVSHTPSPEGFVGVTNSDLAFYGQNVIQGNYNGFQVWDVSNPAAPRLREGKLCPASQSDVSVWKNLLFVSAEAPTARLDCGKDAPREVVSRDRIRGLRIFDITDINNPKYLANVQTCRGSHTHTVVDDPRDKDNIYVYISGTSGIRPSEELARCNDNPWDPQNSNFRIEVIKIPLAHPEQAAVVSSPAIFADPTNGVANALLYPTAHAASPLDTANNRRRAEFDSARVRLAPVQPTAADTARCIAEVEALAKQHDVNLAAGRGGGRGGLPGGGCGRAAGGGRGGRGRGGAADSIPVTREDTARVEFNRAVGALTKLSATSSKADTTSYRAQVNDLAKKYGVASPFAPRTLTQCHDITVYPSVGMAGGACAGMGLLLDIKDTPHPTRLAQVADSNFSFWHSATFSNDGSMVLFSDEWGGGGAAYCRAGDPKNWGADAIFKIVEGQMVFQSYYKLSAPQTQYENCVAHNGSLIPIPGRTIMVQAWYQGGLSIFEWTDPKHPHELAFFDRGPNDGTRLVGGGFWSVYWYNGHIYGSEMERGLDVFDLTPSAAISQNEIDAAKTIHQDFLNVQDQPKFVWPASFALSRAYTDQLERWKGLSADKVSAVRTALSSAQSASGAGRRDALNALAGQVRGYVSGSSDPQRVQWLATSISDLAKAN
ncbi:MAG TPA: hypothetical protein VGQ44_07700 [Gemmatimonadaceae bacterium]|nr:hypothetical protein [Gemmatimonadaceae bacterium]